jgi:NAD(P)-dependent dehydrogenase (short-subunit alcohol dehydrogenase family)
MGRRKEQLEKKRSELSAAIPGAHIEICAGDAVSEADVKGALAQTHKMNNRLDIVVAVVGGSSRAFVPLLMLDAKDMEYDLNVNIVSAFLLMKHGVPMMKNGGSIVCISSTAATLTFNGLAPYCTSKAGLEMLIQCAAEELGPAGVRVNGVRPGLTRKGHDDGLFDNAAILKKFVDTMPLGHAGEADDIGQTVRFLAGPESKQITGQSIAVDGGQETLCNPKLPELMEAKFGAEVMKAVRAGRPPR